MPDESVGTIKILIPDKLLTPLDTSRMSPERIAELKQEILTLFEAKCRVEYSRFHLPIFTLLQGISDGLLHDAINEVISRVKAEPAPCPDCDGNGWYDDYVQDEEGNYIDITTGCHRCKGTGKLNAPEP